MSGHDLKKETHSKKLQGVKVSFLLLSFIPLPLLKVYDSSGKNYFSLNKIQPFFLQSAYWLPIMKHKEFSALTIPPIYTISHIHMTSS